MRGLTGRPELPDTLNTQPLMPTPDASYSEAAKKEEDRLLDLLQLRDDQIRGACAALESAQQALADLQNDLHHLLDASDTTAIMVDQQLRILRFTPNVSRIAGLVLTDAGRPAANALAQLIGSEQLLAAVQAVLNTRVPHNVEVQSISGAWFETSIRPYCRQDGVVEGAIVVFSGISVLKRTQIALAESQARYQALVDWSPQAINILQSGRFVYVNPAAIKTYGAATAEDLLGEPSRDRVHPDDLPAALARMAEIDSYHGSAPLLEMRFLKLDGTVIDVQAQAKMIDFEGAPAIHVAWRDITWQKNAEVERLQSRQRLHMADQVLHLAFHDELTGLPNRRVLSDRMQEAMRTNRRSETYGALVFLDLDNFKALNDTHGHAAGDVLLIEVAQRLSNCVRATDTVARFGGDEFVVMLSQLNAERLASAEQATKLAEKIRLTLAQPYQLTVRVDGALDQSIEHSCTSSIGVALFLNDEASHDDVLQWADAAMYLAKKAGRNRIHLHDPTV